VAGVRVAFAVSSDPSTLHFSAFPTAGGCGFIGSHVLTMLVKKYPSYKFVNLDILDKCATINNCAEAALCSNYTYCHGDICNLDLVAHLMEFHEIDTVMHFAAQSHVDASFGSTVCSSCCYM